MVRDAAQDGPGLYLVARSCGAHGWFTDDGRKITWARVDHSRAEAPHNVWQASPGAHGEHPHRGHGH